jgi:DNA-binding IclR family transcriptional regulator
VPEWGLPPRARAFVCIARDPGVRLRDIATTLGVTERSAFGIVTGLTAAGYVVNDTSRNSNSSIRMCSR